MVSTSFPQNHIRHDPVDRLARSAGHLEGAYALACAAAGADVMSPWASTAMSIHLAAATMSAYLSEQVTITSHTDCVTALTAAAVELHGAASQHPGLPLADLTQIQTRLATAIHEARSLQDGAWSASPPAPFQR
jgi:hypothetical protein